jgi:predicted metal-dependent hydrolase
MHLLKAPRDIIDYMIAHELYHLKSRGILSIYHF